MFNLGYLPGSDRGCITRATSTLPALEQSLALLAPQGVLSLLAYRGHAGGQDEAAAVTRWLQGLDQKRYKVRRFGSETGNQTGPELSLVYRCLDS
jgi:hypothetical protein